MDEQGSDETASTPKAVIDRIESGWSILEFIESRQTVEFPLRLLPEGAEEGNVVEFDLELRPEIEQQRREEIQELQEELIESPDDNE